MKTLTFNAAHNLSRLHGDLVAAIPALAGPVGADGLRQAVMALSGDGQTVTMSVPDDTDETAVQAVLAAHVPEPLPITDDHRKITAKIVTADASSAELYRVTMAKLSGYVADLTVVGVDRGNGAMRTIRASLAAKRLSGAGTMVSQPEVMANHQETGSSGWSIGASIDGADFVVTVTGAASRTIDWFLRGEVISFTPAGRSFVDA